MFTGLVSKFSEETLASAATITPTKDLVNVTGTTTIDTIVPPKNGGFSGFVVIVPTAGTVATSTSGNIMVAVSMPINRPTLLVYSKSANKWYPGPIS
jgi:hypothetical protein